MAAAVGEVSRQPWSRARWCVLEGGGWHPALLSGSTAVIEPHILTEGGKHLILPGGSKLRKVTKGECRVYQLIKSTRMHSVKYEGKLQTFKMKEV